MSTYKLDQPMRWDDFLGMPRDLKKQYLTNLVNLYGATNEMLGDMFYVHKNTIGQFRRELGIGPGKGHKNHMCAIDKSIRDKKWMAFCNGVVGGGDVAAEMPERKNTAYPDSPEKNPSDEAEPAAAPAPKDTVQMCVKEPPLALTELSAVFNGSFKPAEFITWVSKLPIPEGSVCIRVEVKKV